jgi:OOP family OmpA-OmpF porin
MQTRFRFFAAAVFLLLLLSACAGRQILPNPALATSDPVQELASLDKDLKTAREQQLDVLAPDSFARADRLFEDAQRMLTNEDSIADILLKTTSARVELQRAQQSAQISHTVLANVIKVRSMALKAGAAQLGDEFTEAEEGFLKLTRAIEDSELAWVQRHKTKIFNAFDRLELRAIKDKHLNDIRTLLATAEQQKAAKIAPLTFAEARDKLEEADDFISANRYQTEEITKKSAAALFYVRRLNIIMQQTEKLRDQEPEQIAREMEHQLHAAADRLGAPDQRDQLFPEQLVSILDTIDAWEAASQQLNDEVVSKQQLIEKLRGEIAELEGVTKEEREARERLAEEKQAARKRLEEERKSQQLFSQVQDLFTAKEAEIYKQADRFIIRLKAISFPVGSADVSADNYPLLGKVRRAIRFFGQPETVIEGHTDGTGSETANQKLSQSRADAVRSYLVANETLPEDKIKAIGFGSQRPLASDATADGRALNRRIDLIIKPETSDAG